MNKYNPEPKMTVTLKQSEINQQVIKNGRWVFCSNDVEIEAGRLAAEKAGLDTSDRYADYECACRMNGVRIEVTPDEPALTLDEVRDHTGICLTPRVAFDLDAILQELLTNSPSRNGYDKYLLRYEVIIDTLWDLKLITIQQAADLRRLSSHYSPKRAHEQLQTILDFPLRYDD